MASAAIERELRLDHLVHLSDPGTLEATIRELEPWFTVVPGGTHADGLTSNSLIPLSPSGAYLELITFNIKPSPPSHMWGQEVAGPIDYALFGGLKDDQRRAVKEVADEREDVKLAYSEPVAGGRVRPDGKRLEWNVTLPGKAQGRGGLPFFCGDVSPRDWRVPELSAEHPSKTVGVASVTILATSVRIQDLQSFLTALLGEPRLTTGTSATFALSNYGSGALSPEPQVHLREASNEEETTYLAARGDFAQYEWAFWTSCVGGKEGVVASAALGRFVFQQLSR